MDKDHLKIKSSDRTNLVQEYYFSRKLKEIDELRKQGKNIINLGIGSPDQMPSGNTINKLVESAVCPDNHGYQSYNGILALRTAFAEWYKKYFHVELNPQNEVLTLMGSKEGIMHISMAFLNPGDEVLIPDPGYPTYSAASKIAGGTVRTYDLTAENNWLPDIASLEKEDLSKVKIMWINYPNMPTGAKATKKFFTELVAFAHKHNILLCNDNPYSFILNKEHLSLLSIEGAKDVAIELNSLSKSHNMAGWRIGMVAGHSEYINSILKIKSNMDSGMFLPLQLAAAEALNNPPEWYDEINEVYLKRRKIVEEIMDILKCTYDKKQTGLFVWGKILSTYESAESLADKVLQEANVFITPGFIFGKNGIQYIRISLCTKENLLEEAKQRISKCL